MSGPYSTPPPDSPSIWHSTRRVTRSCTKPQREPRAIIPVSMPGPSDLSALPGSSTPRKARKPQTPARQLALPPTPESLPKAAKRPRRSAVQSASGAAEPSAAGPSVKPATIGQDGHTGKIHLAQERLMHDPWKLLVMTTLLNKTSGRAVRPIFEILLQRYPTAHDLSIASIPDMADLLYPLGLFNQRASSLIRFSQQYLNLGWPVTTREGSAPLSNGHTPLNSPIPADLDVKVFYGSGIYASDSFRIYSPLLPGGGATHKEAEWTAQWAEAVNRMHRAGRAFGVTGVGDAGVEALASYMTDIDTDPAEEEWRRVRPTDKELRRYLIWRWGIEGIVYDIHAGPLIKTDRDRKRLAWLLDEI